MGAEYIGGGLTVDTSKTIEDVKAVVESFREQILAKADDIDPSGFFEDEELGGLIDYIVGGVAFILEEKLGGRYVASWDIPGTPDLRFLTFGGMSWGDSPFDGYDGVVFAGDAAHHVPEFGRAVGILGGGIRIEYEA